MPTNSDRTVREIAALNPAAARIFETLGIDYCCGGNLSLSIACERANVAVEKIVGLLDTPQPPSLSDVSNDTPLGELTRLIVERHHAFVRRETPRIQALLAKVCEKHGRAHRELSEVSDFFATLEADLAAHMMKEERILFPYIEALEGSNKRSACFASVENPIAVMVADHDQAGAILSTIRALTSDYRTPEGACATFQALYRALEEFERDLHRHVHLENNILFPRAIAAERERNGASASAN